MSKLHEVASLGQSIWLDFILRSYMTSGELQNLVAQGLRGLTSNPTIFEKAIAGSTDYDQALMELAQAGKSVTEIYEALVIEDIRHAADILRPVYDQTGGEDGYVSLEVRPTLAHDVQGTLAEACRLFKRVDRPNVMIKIPATPEGFQAVAEAIGQGIPVNVTLIFSLEQYAAAAHAYMAGLEKLAASGGDLSRVASVASFFVSRIDTAVDRELAVRGESELQGKIAIASAKLAYAHFGEILASERWRNLATQGARIQRPLWASTGTKNPAYSDTLYVDNLIGAHTVNTLPPITLQAFMDHGKVTPSLETGLEQARGQIDRLAELGISLEAITRRLLDEGVVAFANSFEALMKSIEAKREQVLKKRGGALSRSAGFPMEVEAALQKALRENVITRIWALDHTLWKPEPREITNRLGWLHSAETMQQSLPRLEAFAQTVRAEGYTHALLLGMGGSSLAPEVFSKVFGARAGFPVLEVLDSTDPGAVLSYARCLEPSKTLYIVSSKSGGTVETFSFFKFFYNQVAARVGIAQAGKHFIAITDPGSGLAEIARHYHFREAFLNDPNIGGRYSALSYFGLVPAALIGIDLELLLERALRMSEMCQQDERTNPGLYLGVALGEMARRGRDKLSLLTSPRLSSFADWIEQLIAESTGKQGTGILPVVGETLGEPEAYGNDRFFVYLRLEGDDTFDAAIRSLESARHPVMTLNLKDLFDLGAQFFLWEMATAVAGYCLGVNPFDQPNVEAAKALARQTVATYQAEGKLPETQPILMEGDIAVYGDIQADSVKTALDTFLQPAAQGAYIALQAYLPPTSETNAALLALRTRLRARTKLAVTVGYGPRYLHSTGQLHKGDAGRGLFIQITATPSQDMGIPEEAGADASSLSFGVLELAQALGDAQALRVAGRKVIRFHLGTDVLSGLNRLLQAL